eukprot:CAMPEP_0184656648 /NCGR_PEP_ID=MMETSP0308-20130426/16655_1 /TAXON_ID=38269 /ORGANISM="Gloeochaete witrockiana, Strain SAG 46.84" /LENGTH=75 /DNA_ID=CAMNT_0027093867 /DNA_START=174 /DNA_END=401 /DNA_ORIENTATION=+
MSDFQKACPELKQEYSTCFNKWYTEKFLKGDMTQECQNEWEDYRKCVLEYLKRKELGFLAEPSTGSEMDSKMKSS